MSSKNKNSTRWKRNTTTNKLKIKYWKERTENNSLILLIFMFSSAVTIVVLSFFLQVFTSEVEENLLSQ